MRTRPFAETFFNAQHGKKALVLLPGPTLKPHNQRVKKLIADKQHDIWMCNYWTKLRDYLRVDFFPTYLFLIDGGVAKKPSVFLKQVLGETALVMRSPTNLPGKHYHWRDKDKKWPDGTFNLWFTGDLMVQASVCCAYDEICVFGWSCSALLDSSKRHHYVYNESSTHRGANLTNMRVSMGKFFRSLNPSQCEALCIFEGSNHPFYDEMPCCFYG